MRKKSVRYSVLAIPLLILIIYMFREKTPFGGEVSFASEPKDEITRIEFSDGNKTLILEKQGEEWLVNQKSEARKTSILFILKILTEMQVKSPVTPELFRSEIIDKGIEPVNVKVSERGKIIRSFIVYKTASNKYGNIMKLKEGSRPFIVSVPGNETEIGSAFTLNDLFWQPYTVFSLLPSEISSVSFENIADTDASFIIRNENRRVALYGNSGELAGWDTSRLIRYLSYFTHVPFESWALDLSADEKGDIENSVPLYKITVVTSEGDTRVLRLWKRSLGENGEIKDDTDRMWAKTDDNGEIFIIRYVDIDPLIKKRSYFYPG